MVQPNNLHSRLGQDRADEAAGDAKPSFLKRLSAAVSQVTTCAPLEYMTTLHPCFVNGKRTLVHRRRLKTVQPGVSQRRKQYAVGNRFTLLEDRRKRQLECRDERRRMAPALMFAAELVSARAVAEDGGLNEGRVSVIPSIDVIVQRDHEQPFYLLEASKRFVSQPYGEVELILGVAAEVRLHGENDASAPVAWRCLRSMPLLSSIAMTTRCPRAAVGRRSATMMVTASPRWGTTRLKAK